MNQTKLKRQLLSLIDGENEIELEKVERYCNLVKIYKKLDQSLKDNGYMIEVRNGAQTFLKANSAIGEKVKINQALIKLGEFFDKKQAELEASKEKTNFANPSDFL
ncbi:P27 family phage terminase small subunit [Streptococcus hyointestinalis]|nr:P27 family phage terminase small subunit [Streptococcus hyointestinalis]